MQELDRDILCLQERHISTNTFERHDGYKCVFSTSVTDKDRIDRENAKSEKKGKGKGEGKKSKDRIDHKSIELAGVGFGRNDYFKSTMNRQADETSL